MNDDHPKSVMVVLTKDLARRSLAVANAAGLSRSAWLRHVIESALDREGTT
jgi:hypothetical protein